uniref:Bromodomain adjacent to zinc finger domain protein 1A n=1 Tax=Kryptolebias marmoratus TaxID=37003 RepID=A0A3Q3BM48_KRYMA
MPLLHRKAFIRQRPPADLRPDEEVFLCKITHEVFRTYDEFFERTILCNSLVWSCALTGRAGLTYLEAMESERRAKQSLQNFPQVLMIPLLHLAALSHCCRLSELCEDVYSFAKDRFFPGEVVDVSGRNGARYQQNQVSNKSQKKSTLSREKLKLLFKQHCEAQKGTITLKPSTVKKYHLSEQNFTQFFPDDPPFFPLSFTSNGGSSGQACVSPLNALEEKLKLLQKKEEMAAAAQDRVRLKKEREELQEAKRREREDKDKLREEQRRRLEEEKHRKKEEKERRKLEKEREREKLKEEKRKYAERLKQWNQPREDMECEDLKELPCPVPVRTRLPTELFGEALMVLEFLRAFGEVFDLRDEFPDGITLEVLEEALVCSDPEGPLCELLFFFLTAIFQALDEEQEEVAAEQAEDLREVLDDDSDPTQSALSAIASLAAAWPQLHHGCTLKELDLDSCTLSEILRLHILASGADCNHGNAKFRYQKQGGFTVMDDPCVELRLSEPALLKRLSCTPVYDLTAGEKLKILQALVGKLLTLASSRDLIEDSVEEQKAARQELREIRAEQHRREREEAAYRVRLRKEEKLREQEHRLKEKLQTYRLINKCLSLQVRKLQEQIQKAAACTSLLPLGRDRLYRRYWILPSASALFVEDDFYGLTEDMLKPRPKPAEDSLTNRKDVKNDPFRERWVIQRQNHAASGPASIPVIRPNQWSFYSSMEEVDKLIEALNPRGHRESSLREALLQDRDKLQQLLQNCDRNSEMSQTVPQCTAAADTLMEVRLRDLLLDMEDRIHQGTLGTLKVMDRQVWRSALEAGNYELLCSDETSRINGPVEALEVDCGQLRHKDRLQELKTDGSVTFGTSGSGTPQMVSSTVQILAQALWHIEQGIEKRFLKPPLGDEDSKKDQKMKKKRKEEEQACDDCGSDSGRVVKTVLERWRESLQSCSSLSQVFVHLSSLERSILWSRSILNARCRICRRKGDADNMLLCDCCDRGHHTHCLRPRLKSIPGGEWFCPDCRPKQRSTRISSSRQRSSIDDDEEDDENDKEEERSEEEEESEEDEQSEEEEEEKVVR